MYALSSLIAGTFSWSGLANAALDAFLVSSAIAFISSSVNLVKHLTRCKPISQTELAKCTNQCFIAGTLVHCEDGLKNIEEVQIGDRVLSYNEETGEQQYKQVVRLFRNESKDWIGITVNDTEIVSTLGHKYYLPLTKQWVSARDLKTGDTVLLSNGQYAKVQLIRSIHYDTPQTTYNFEVEDNHTYYVGNGVLVHNQNCSNTIKVDSVDDALNMAEQHLGSKQHYYKNNKNILVSDADPTKIVRFDIDLSSTHVKRFGQHLNLETYAQPFGTVDGKPLKNLHIFWG